MRLGRARRRCSYLHGLLASLPLERRPPPMTLQLVLAMLMVGRAQPPQPVLVGSTPVFMVGGFSAYIVLLPTIGYLPGNCQRLKPVLP